jgi:DNA-binding NtrC family response regulator
MTDKILLADDEMTFRETLARFLRDELLDVTTVDNGLDAIEAARTTAFGVVILDIQMPGADGIKALRDIMAMRPAARVIMVTAYGTVERAVEAIKLGACDYVVKPVMFDDILVKIKQHLRFAELQAENLELKRVLNDQFDLSQMIGESENIRMVLDMIQKVSQTRSNVLITGESGTGKELVARAIHSLGQTNGKRFVAVNCGAIPETLLESELFGHKKGSFTSASEDKKGLFECARGGTLFLDEIGYMDINCQIKLLRAVEQRQITPVGSTEPIALELRLVAATNRDLLKEIRNGNFREDLYYRLNVVGIHTPALRERVEDIPLLVNHFVQKYNTELGKQCQGVTEEGMRMLMAHEWKGNIRELENVIERSIIFSEEDLIGVENLGLLSPYVDAVDGADDNLQNTLKAFEKQHILRVLKKHNHDKTQASRALGVGLSSLYRKMDELDIRVARAKL